MSEEKLHRIVKPKTTPFFLSIKFYTVFILLLELVALIFIVIWFTSIVAYAYSIVSFVANLLLIPIVNSRMDSSYKITWLILFAVAPIFGAIAYLLFANKKFSKKELKKFNCFRDNLNAIYNNKKAITTAYVDVDKDPDAYAVAHYLKNYANASIFRNSHVTYFPWGEDAYKAMKEKLLSAKHYIFMEYFIVEPGLFWDDLLTILKEKAEQGLDVRVMYDDFGSYKTLPRNYPEILSSYGIKCLKFAKIRPVLDVRMNNRDHRKIMIIDGCIGFTGGINLADEYINEKVRFGKWKDNAIMIEGESVFGLNALFLANWKLLSDFNGDMNIDYEQYSPNLYLNEHNLSKPDKGLVAPYGTLPYTFETVGLNVYRTITMRAKKYLYISTPYLILNDGMIDAIAQASKNGVKVKMLLPHIPDKKIIFLVTRSYYRKLVEAGVEIYEYLPGFVHAKMFLADDTMGVVGTINLDYRSLFLHSENGVFLYQNDCLKDIKHDFEQSFALSRLYDMAEVRKFKPIKRFLAAILRIFAPLF